MVKWECDECGNEQYEDYPTETVTDRRYFDVMNKTYDKLLELFRQHVTELTRAPSEQDPVQINLIQGQINVLKYVINIDRQT